MAGQSAPERIRTPDTTVRSRALYPAELLAHPLQSIRNIIDFTTTYDKCQGKAVKLLSAIGRSR